MSQSFRYSEDAQDAEDGRIGISALGLKALAAVIEEQLGGRIYGVSVEIGPEGRLTASGLLREPVRAVTIKIGLLEECDTPENRQALREAVEELQAEAEEDGPSLREEAESNYLSDVLGRHGRDSND